MPESSRVDAGRRRAAAAKRAVAVGGSAAVLGSPGSTTRARRPAGTPA